MTTAVMFGHGNLAVFALGGEPGPIDGTAYAVPAADQSRLADLQFSSVPPATAIPESVAIQVAKTHYDPARLGAKTVEAYLATVTETAADRVGQPLRDRPIWIVKMAGFSVAGESVLNAGLNRKVHFLTVLYVVLDAETGDFLYGEWQE